MLLRLLPMLKINRLKMVIMLVGKIIMQIQTIHPPALFLLLPNLKNQSKQPTVRLDHLPMLTLTTAEMRLNRTTFICYARILAKEMKCLWQ
ncbi:uncharacterized protein LOC144145847 isoform X2 [Haemaphysalis longicornis]